MRFPRGSVVSQSSSKWISSKKTYELLLLSSVFNLDDWLGTLVNDLEWPVLHVGLNLGIGELSSDQSLSIEDGVVWVHGDLVLGGITDKSLRVVESDIGWGGSVTLVVGDDFNSLVGPNTDTRVGGSLLSIESSRGGMRVTYEIDTDGLGHFADM